MSKYTVEYDYVETKWGRRAMWIAGFNTRAEAEAFAETKADAEIIETVKAYKMTEDGEAIALW